MDGVGAMILDCNNLRRGDLLILHGGAIESLRIEQTGVLYSLPFLKKAYHKG